MSQFSNPEQPISSNLPPDSSDVDEKSSPVSNKQKLSLRRLSPQKKRLWGGLFAVVLTVMGLSTALLLSRGSLDVRQRATGQVCVCSAIEDSNCGCPAGQTCNASSLGSPGYCSGGVAAPLPTPTPLPTSLPTPTPVSAQVPTPTPAPISAGATLAFSSTGALLEAQNLTNYAVNAGQVSPASAAEEVEKLRQEMARLETINSPQLDMLKAFNDFAQKVLRNIRSRGMVDRDNTSRLCGVRYVYSPETGVVGKAMNIEAEIFSGTQAVDGSGLFQLNGAALSDVKRGRLDGTNPDGRWFHVRQIPVQKSGENVVEFGLTKSNPPAFCNRGFFEVLRKPACVIRVNGQEITDNGGNDAQAQTITVPEGSTVTLEANGVGTLGTGVFVSPVNNQNWTRQDSAGQKAVLQWRAARSRDQDTFFVTCNNKWAPGTEDYVCTGNPFSKGGATPGFGHDCGGKDLVRIKVNPLRTPTPVRPPTTGTPVTPPVSNIGGPGTPPTTETLPVQRINFLNLRGLVRLLPGRSFVLSGTMSAPVPVNEWIYELSTTANFSSNVERVSQKPNPVRVVNSFSLTRTLSSAFRIACGQRIYWRVSAVTTQRVRLKTPVQSTNVVCRSGVR